MLKQLKRLWNDETGGEVIEYALIAGLVVIVAIAAITTVGTKARARWNTVSSAL